MTEKFSRGYWSVDPKEPHMIVCDHFIDGKSITRDIINVSMSSLSREEVYANAKRIVDCVNMLMDFSTTSLVNGDMEEIIGLGIDYLCEDYDIDIKWEE